MALGQEIQVSGSKYPEDSKQSKPKYRCQRQLAQDLETAFETEDFSDVKVACGDKIFNCHQFMLSCRYGILSYVLVTPEALCYLFSIVIGHQFSEPCSRTT